MSVQSVYLINRGGEGRNQRILVVSKYDLPDPPPVPSLYSVGGGRSPLLSVPPEKHVIFPKSFFPPLSTPYKLWLAP